MRRAGGHSIQAGREVDWVRLAREDDPLNSKLPADLGIRVLPTELEVSGELLRDEPRRFGLGQVVE
jgi:hypothetical protein